MALIPIRYNLRSMKARITPTLVAVFGIAGGGGGVSCHAVNVPGLS